MQFTDEQIEQQIAAVCAMVRAAPPRSVQCDSEPTDTADEYASERLGAAELGVGRFHDGRGL